MSNKTMEKVLEFIDEQIKIANTYNGGNEVDAFKLIRDYIESKQSELTPEELVQMKEKTKKVPVVKVNAVDIVEQLPEGTSPKYDMAKGYTIFYLTNEGLDFQIIGEPRSMFICPLLPTITVDELIQVRDDIKKSIVSGTIEGTHICDGGEQGRGLFFVTTNGTIIEYKK